MTGMGRFATALAAALLCSAAAAQEQAFDDGMVPRWEVVEIASGLREHAASAITIVDGLRPNEWTSNGAPEVYLDQARELRAGLGDLDLSAAALARSPEKLSYVVDTFLWLDRAHSMMRSLSAGVRKYQSPALADLMDAAENAHGGSVERLKEYMRQLAASAESEMAIAHEEAQRCRGQIVSRPGR